MPSDAMPKTTSSLLDAQGQVIHQAAEHAQAQAQATGDQIAESIRRQPLTAALVIFGIGYLLGKIT